MSRECFGLCQSGLIDQERCVNGVHFMPNVIDVGYDLMYGLWKEVENLTTNDIDPNTLGGITFW